MWRFSGSASNSTSRARSSRLRAEPCAEKASSRMPLACITISLEAAYSPTASGSSRESSSATALIAGSSAASIARPTGTASTGSVAPSHSAPGVETTAAWAALMPIGASDFFASVRKTMR